MARKSRPTRPDHTPGSPRLPGVLLFWRGGLAWVIAVLAVSALGALVGLRLGGPILAVAFAASAVVSNAICVSDARTRRVPNELTAWLVVSGALPAAALLVWRGDTRALLTAVTLALALGLALYVAWRLRLAGLGGADVKLAPVALFIACFQAPLPLATLWLCAACLGTLVSAAATRLRRGGASALESGSGTNEAGNATPASLALAPILLGATWLVLVLTVIGVD